MNHEHDYVNHFYEKYEGRVAIGVGYNKIYFIELVG
jgi:hypothetical protein